MENNFVLIGCLFKNFLENLDIEWNKMVELAMKRLIAYNFVCSTILYRGNISSDMDGTVR